MRFIHGSGARYSGPFVSADTGTIYLAADGTIQQVSTEARSLLAMDAMDEGIGSVPFSAGSWAGCDAGFDFWTARNTIVNDTKLVTATYRETGCVAKFLCTISELQLRTERMHSRVLIRDVTEEIQAERWIHWHPSLLEMIARRCEINETLDAIAQAAEETFEADLVTICVSELDRSHSSQHRRREGVGSQPRGPSGDYEMDRRPLPSLTENVYELGDGTEPRRRAGELEIVGARLQPEGSCSSIARALAHLASIALNNYRQDLRLILLREAELKVLGIQLHNDPIQRLSALHNLVDLDERSGLHREINDCVESLRTLSFAYYPALEEHGLAGAVRLLVDKHSRAYGWRAQCDVVCHRVSIDAETVVFRVIQEAIQNAAKHAEASQVVVRLWQSGDKLVGFVEDDGIGVRTSSWREDGDPGYHVGITASRFSVVQLGGRLRVTVREEGGTRVWFEVPGEAQIDPRRRSLGR